MRGLGEPGGVTGDYRGLPLGVQRGAGIQDPGPTEGPKAGVLCVLPWIGRGVLHGFSVMGLGCVVMREVL